ncbi:tRNA1(Val) (adenine(37)-N6)-methyltransferase [Paracoccus sediminicola]|uniref:tRNA1(Val) (adenine(37)-N6)-methyltransferase n=1 Tax=Paracoccus sediminicola TaxID=3017783 RepID=UPI0022F05089|nr:methyltransferase [Paracoccus sediminicola]WBU55979.1 methyltransferase [Paracoccus sediminicola]
MSNTRIDAFLGGRLHIEQPAKGYRAGADAVMLAAACPAIGAQTVLELGCGVGVASLCLLSRQPGLRVTGVEREAGTAALARQNAARNAVAMSVITADLAARPAELRAQSFDHVIMNPPYFDSGTAAPSADRAAARHEETPLDEWITVALRRLRPGGVLTMVHLASRLDAILAGLMARAGDVTVLPIAARAGRDAGRVILTAKKGARGPLSLRAPFIMHESGQHLRDGEDLTQAAQAVLRFGQMLSV